MLSLPRSVRIYLAIDPVDFRKAFDGLSAIIREQFGADPLGGDLFVFFNRRRDRVKLLLWDANGFWLFYKRLERGTFEMLPASRIRGQRVEIDRGRLASLLDGLEIRNSRYRRHFAAPILLTERRSGERGRGTAGSGRSAAAGDRAAAASTG